MNVNAKWGPAIPTLLSLEDLSAHKAEVSFGKDTGWMSPQPKEKK